MNKYTFNFDYKKTKVSELEAFVKYCIDDLYGVQKMNVYNETILHLGALIDKVFLDGKPKTLFSFSDLTAKDDVKVAFVISKKKENVINVLFDIDFNKSDRVGEAINNLANQFIDKAEKDLDKQVNEEFKYMAELMMNWRMNSVYKIAYVDLDIEYEATLGALLYAMKKVFDER